MNGALIDTVHLIPVTTRVFSSVLQLQEELLDVSTAHSTKQYVLEK
jgi:hypothetical protein